MQPESQKRSVVLDWARRTTAFGVWVYFWLSRSRPDSVAAAIHQSSHYLDERGMPSQVVFGTLGVIWLAYLTQLQLRWILGLPFYVLGAPPTLLVAWAGGAVLGPIFRATQKVVNPAAKDSGAEKRAQRRRTLRRLWVVLCIIWVAVLRNVNSEWAIWLPVGLTLPLWYVGVKWSLATALSPPSIPLKLLRFADRKLEEAIREWHDKPEKDRKTAANNLFFWATVGGGIARRYDGDGKFVTIQREALIVFSAVLLGAVALSCMWFGLLGYAVLRTAPEALVGYNFFGPPSMLDSALWALGCMTTAIGFPAGSSRLVKILHALMLLTGILQVTYLLACFSIIASTEASRVGERATVPVAELQAKVSMALVLREAWEKQRVGV